MEWIHRPSQNYGMYSQTCSQVDAVVVRADDNTATRISKKFFLKKIHTKKNLDLLNEPSLATSSSAVLYS
jgi:hypothetical protein